MSNPAKTFRVGFLSHHHSPCFQSKASLRTIIDELFEWQCQEAEKQGWLAAPEYHFMTAHWWDEEMAAIARERGWPATLYPVAEERLLPPFKMEQNWTLEPIATDVAQQRRIIDACSTVIISASVRRTQIWTAIDYARARRRSVCIAWHSGLVTRIGRHHPPDSELPPAKQARPDEGFRCQPMDVTPADMPPPMRLGRDEWARREGNGKRRPRR